MDMRDGRTEFHTEAQNGIKEHQDVGLITQKLDSLDLALARLDERFEILIYKIDPIIGPIAKNERTENDEDSPEMSKLANYLDNMLNRVEQMVENTDRITRSLEL